MSCARGGLSVKPLSSGVPGGAPVPLRIPVLENLTRIDHVRPSLSVREADEGWVGIRTGGDEFTDFLQGLLYINGATRRKQYLGFSLVAAHGRTLHTEAG